MRKRSLKFIETIRVVLSLGLLTLLSSVLHAQPDPDGMVLVEEGPLVNNAGDPVPNNNNLATRAIAFASSELGPSIDTPYHLVENINDGFYGNAFSWIAGDDDPFFDAFAGIDLGATPVQNIQSVAWGRSNVLSGDVCGGGVCTDRNEGFYTLQYTQVANPSTNLDLNTTGNPASGWVDIGNITYITAAGEGTLFNMPWARHRYNFDPVEATGIRLLVPGSGIGSGTAIDELEIFDYPGGEQVPPPPPPPMIIQPSSGFSIDWDGNDGLFFDDNEPPSGAIVPDNGALAANGSTAFSSSDLGPQLGIEFHVKENLNDGFYGNSNSWIGGDDNPFAPDAFAGIVLAESMEISSIAWGRDNGNNVTDACGGQCTDRSDGTYTLQFTRLESPNANVSTTENADTGWQTLGSVTYRGGQDEYSPFLRHEFSVGEGERGVVATGVRILVPANGLGGGTAIDEIEVYGTPFPILQCDLNRDGICDVNDIDLLTAEIIAGNSPPEFDLDANGFVDRGDRSIWVVSLMNTWFGDANLDGEFNSSDFVGVFTTGKFETGATATWAEGDWNGDGVFGSGDFVTAFTDGGFELGPRAAAAVPEPTNPALTALLGMLLLCVVRRR